MSADFTLARYGELLDLALASGYAFVRFTELDAVDDRAIVMRHDIDFSARFLAPLSAIERERGAVSTWFLQPGAATYRWDGPEMRAAIGQVLADGHELGLHFDANRCASEAEILDGVARERAALEEAYGVVVGAVSWHQPGRKTMSHLEVPGMVNTYAPRFFTEIGYVSDSNMQWRGNDLAAMLRAGEPRMLQVLTHPVWWQETWASMGTRLRALAAELGLDPAAIMSEEQAALAAAEGA